MCLDKMGVYTISLKDKDICAKIDAMENKSAFFSELTDLYFSDDSDYLMSKLKEHENEIIIINQKLTKIGDKRSENAEIVLKSKEVDGRTILLGKLKELWMTNKIDDNVYHSHFQDGKMVEEMAEETLEQFSK